MKQYKEEDYEGKKVLAMVMVSALAVGMATTVSAADVTLKLAHADAEGSIFLTKGRLHFQEKLEELSGGSMKVELYRNGTMGSLSEVAEAIQMGTIDIAPIVTTTLANFVPELNVFDLPFLMDDYEMAYKVLDGEVGEKLGSLWKQAPLK